MCHIMNKLKNQHPRYGYKVVFKNDKGEYFSPATGAKYVDGKKVRGRKHQKRIGDYFDPALFHSSFFNPKYFGFTAVFWSYLSARELRERLTFNNADLNFVILKVYISEDLHEGTYGSAPVFIGRRISSFQEI